MTQNTPGSRCEAQQKSCSHRRAVGGVGGSSATTDPASRARDRRSRGDSKSLIAMGLIAALFALAPAGCGKRIGRPDSTVAAGERVTVIAQGATFEGRLLSYPPTSLRGSNGSPAWVVIELDDGSVVRAEGSFVVALHHRLPVVPDRRAQAGDRPRACRARLPRAPGSGRGELRMSPVGCEAPRLCWVETDGFAGRLSTPALLIEQGASACTVLLLARLKVNGRQWPAGVRKSVPAASVVRWPSAASTVLPIEFNPKEKPCQPESPSPSPS